MINPQEVNLGNPVVPTAIGPTETLQVEDEAPSETQDILDVAPAPQPIPKEEAQRQAVEAHLGLGERSPGVETLAATLESNGSQGYRDFHANLARMDTEAHRLRAAEAYLKNLKGPPTQADAEIIRSIATTGLAPTRDTVWERGFASFFMNALIGRFLSQEGENAIKEALRTNNDNTLDIINKGEDMFVKRKAGQALLSELETERGETSTPSKVWDFAKQLVPFYSTYQAGKVDPNNSYITPGSARMERIQKLHLMPAEQAIAQLRADVEILKGSSMIEAIKYVEDFMNFTLTDRNLGNIFGGLDIVTAPGVGLATKMGLKGAKRLVRGVDLAEEAAKASGGLKAEETLAKAAAGKSLDEKIKDTVVRAVNAATGTKEVNATSVAAAVGDNSAAAAIEWAKEPARVRGIKEMENVLPTFMFPSAGVRIGVNKSGELIRRLTDEAIYRRDRLMAVFREAATIDRLPAEARAVGFKETIEYLKNQYRSVHDAVLDIGPKDDRRFLQTKEIPGERTYGNVDRVVVYMGKPDGQWFDTKFQAELFAKEFYGMNKGYAIADEGGKYAITVVKTVDETSPTVREALRIAADNKTPTPGLLGMMLPAFLRTADDQVSQFARQTRKQAVYGLQAIQKNIAEIAKPIGKLSRDEARQLKEVLEGNRLYYDEAKGVYGKWHQTLKELEMDYVNRYERLPTEKEINAYYAYVALNDFDYISRNMTIYRDKSRQGVMNGNYKWMATNEDGSKWVNNIDVELKPVDRLPFENQEDWTIWINPAGTEFDPKSVKSHKRDLLADDRATIDDMLKNGYKIYQVVNPEVTPFKPITGERVVNFVISKDIELTNLDAKQIPYKAGGHFEYANSWLVKQPIITRGVLEKKDPYNTVAFHGTQADFEKFSEQHLGSSTNAPSAKKGFFFSKNPATAETYASNPWVDVNRVIDEDGDWRPEGLQFMKPEHRARYDNIEGQALKDEEEYNRLYDLRDQTTPGSPAFEDLSRQMDEVTKRLRQSEDDMGSLKRDVSWDIDYVEKDFDGGNIRPSKLKMENPYVHDFKGSEYRDETYNDILIRAKAAGHDSVILKNTYDGGPQDDIYVVFKPDQIASKFEDTSVTKYEHIYKGDQTIFSFSSEAQAKKFAERMDKARQLLKEGKNKELITYLDKNLPFDIVQFKGLFESYTKDGKVVPARLNIDDPIRHVYTKERMTDRYTDLPKQYENFQDTIRSSYNLWNEIDKKYAGQRDPPLWTVRENTENGKEIFKIDTADMIDPMATMNRAVANVMRNSMMADYKISAVESWVAEFGHLLGNVTPESLRNNPAQILHNKRITENIEQQDVRRAAEASRQAIIQLLGSAGEIERTAGWIKRKLTDEVYERMGAKYADVLEANPLFSQDPTRAARATAFHLKLGLFNPTQYIIQAQTLTHIMALAGPVAGVKSLAAGQLMRMFVNHLDNPAYMDYVSKMAGRMGYDPKMFRESFDEMRKSGIFHVEGEHSWKEDLIDQHIITTKSGQFLDTATFFFKEGERLPRLTAWNASFMEWRMANPDAVIDNAARRKILERANIMTVNMTRDANAAWQQGIWSIPTQFMSYQARLMEQMLGTRLTTAEKARLFTAYSLMYGVPSAATLYFPWPLQEEFRQKAISFGYNPDQAGAFASAIANGLPGLTLSLISGTDYNLSERYGPGGFSVIRDLVYGDKNLGEVMFGPANDIIGDIFKSMDPLLGAAKAVFSDDPNTSYSATVEDIVSATQNISSVNNAVKMIWALNTGTWISKNNVKLSQVTNFDAVWMGITGMSTRDLSDVFLMQREMKSFEEAKKGAEKEIGIAWRRAMQAAANNDYDQYRNYMKRANAFFVAGGFQEKDRATVYQKAMQANMDLASKIRMDFWKNAPKDLVKPRYDQWINQNKVTN